MMTRVVQPEWLDALAPDDPDALGSRRDIQRLNALMGNAAILLGMLESVLPPGPRRIVELGAGDGAMSLRLAVSLSRRWTGVRVLLVDRQNVVTDWTRAGFAALGWTVEVVNADVFDWLRKPGDEPTDLLLANLFLHHFSDAQLSSLFRLAAPRARCFAACEPCRSAFALAASHLVGFIGCNRVTRHDAPASVRAGFNGRELSRLWPARPDWRLREQNAGPFSHAFLAERCVP